MDAINFRQQLYEILKELILKIIFLLARSNHFYLISIYQTKDLIDCLNLFHSFYLFEKSYSLKVQAINTEKSYQKPLLAVFLEVLHALYPIKFAYPERTKNSNN